MPETSEVPQTQMTKLGLFKLRLDKKGWEVTGVVSTKGREKRKVRIREIHLLPTLNKKRPAVPVYFLVEDLKDGSIFSVTPDLIESLNRPRKVGSKDLQLGDYCLIFILSYPGFKKFNEIRVTSISKKTLGKVFAVGGAYVVPSKSKPFFEVKGVQVVEWSDTGDKMVGYYDLDKVELTGIKFAEFSDIFEDEPVKPASSKPITEEDIYKAVEWAIKNKLSKISIKSCKRQVLSIVDQIVEKFI